VFHLPAAVRKYYQGTSLCNPFFFLLVDSVLGLAAHGWPESLLVLPSLFVVVQAVEAAAAGVVAAPVPLAVAVGVVVPLPPGAEAAPVADGADELSAAPGAPAGASAVAVAGCCFDCLGSSEGEPPTISPDLPVTADGIPSGATPPSVAGGPASGTSSDGALAPVGTVSTAAEFPGWPTVLAPTVLPAAEGLSTSPASISLGGFRLGLPLFEAWETSGLLCTAASPRRITVGCGSVTVLCLAT